MIFLAAAAEHTKAYKNNELVQWRQHHFHRLGFVASWENPFFVHCLQNLECVYVRSNSAASVLKHRESRAVGLISGELIGSFQGWQNIFWLNFKIPFKWKKFRTVSWSFIHLSFLGQNFYAHKNIYQPWKLYIKYLQCPALEKKFLENSSGKIAQKSIKNKNSNYIKNSQKLYFSNPGTCKCSHKTIKNTETLQVDSSRWYFDGDDKTTSFLFYLQT